MTSFDSQAAPPAGAVLARKAHRTLEPLHIVAYFAPEPGEHYKAAGLKGGMRQYFASRSAPLGKVPADVVISTFFNFDPERVRQAIPSAWDDTTPEAMLKARYDGVDAAYRRILGEDILASEEMAEAAELAHEAASVLDIVGRPLFAAHAALPWPTSPHLRLFHAQTLMRESRGDAHIAALVLAGLDAVEALVTYLPMGEGMNEAAMRATRGWSDEQWEAAIARCQARGLLDAERALTVEGAALRQRIEDQTDAADVAAYLHLGAERSERLRTLARPWAKTITASIFGG
jgi:hypothetical protein